MRSEGNDEIPVCITNLLAIKKGEVPYAREKGISPYIFDGTEDDVELSMAEEAQEQVEVYEPRVDYDDISFETIRDDGDISLTVSVEDTEDNEDEEDDDE